MGGAAEMRHGCRASAFAAVNSLHLVRTLASEPQPVCDRVIAGNEWCKLAPNLPFALGSTNDQLGWIPDLRPEALRLLGCAESPKADMSLGLPDYRFR